MRILVTGGFGFLGRHVCAALEAAGHRATPVSRRSGHDLCAPGRAEAAIAQTGPDVVVHLAARLGGGPFEAVEPDRLFSDNMRMGLNVVEAAADAGVRLVVAGTASSYPRDCPVPFREETFWDGFPAPDDASYGVAKKALLVMAQAFRQERGLQFSYLVPTNLHGPGSPFEFPHARIVADLVRRISEAHDHDSPEVLCRGTGNVARSFLYVEDAADAVRRACEASLYTDDLVNLPGDREVTMDEVAGIVADTVGYPGRIAWSNQSFDGQPRRALDGRRARALLGWSPSTALEEGVRRTVEWYRSGGGPAT